MKKILSVMLAIMMLFGALSISASAEPIKIGQIYTSENPVTNPVFTVPNDACVIVFDFGNGTATNPSDLWVYETGTTPPGFVPGENITGTYIMLPRGSADLTPGSVVYFPAATGPEGYVCSGWQLVSQGYEDSGIVYGAGLNAYWTIPQTAKGRVVTFKAGYSLATPEEDTMKTVLGVLTKVFGTIIGILFLDGNAGAGIELVNKLLAGIV